jgi:transposase
MALSPIGETVILTCPEHFAKSSSVSCICSLGDEPVYVNYREESNTAEDFFKFIVHAIYDKYLVAGDTLVLDNAAVHDSEEILESLVLLFQLLGIKLVYLPAYSPEFNPCELIFAQVKSFLRRKRDTDLSMLEWIAAAFAIVTNKNVQKYYNKCCRG